MSGFNYSKWDAIVLSDDEEDMHPNIDRNLMIRLKREKRAQQEMEEKAERARLEGIETKEAAARRQELDRKINFHSDAICTVVSERTFVNKNELLPKGEAAVAALAPKPKDPEAEYDAYQSYVTQNEKALSKYVSMSLDNTEEFLKENPEILADHATGWMLLHMLDLEMNKKTAKMKTVARQYLILQNILDLAKQAHGSDPRAAVRPFFKQIVKPEQAEKLKVEVLNFADKIKKRAIDKKNEQAAAAGQEEEEVEAQEIPREQRLGPGGLDPVEVFAELPEAMQKAFEAKDMELLYDALTQLGPDEARRVMKRCEDSGLWVPEKREDEGKEKN